MKILNCGIMLLLMFGCRDGVEPLSATDSNRVSSCELFQSCTNDFPMLIEDDCGTVHIRFRGCTNLFPVVFEDQSLSKQERSTILSDYRLIVGDQELLCRRRERREKQTIRADGSQLHLSRYLCFSGSTNNPDGYENEYDILGIAGDGSEHLVIPVRLSDAYRQVLTIQKKQPEAFQKLDAFIEYMNDLENVPLPIADDVLYFCSSAESYRKEFEENMHRCFVSEYSVYEYDKLSMLTFLTTKRSAYRRELSELSDEEFDNTLLTEIDVHDLKKGMGNDIPIIYHDKKWKFMIFRYGT